MKFQTSIGGIPTVIPWQFEDKLPTHKREQSRAESRAERSRGNQRERTRIIIHTLPKSHLLGKGCAIVLNDSYLVSNDISMIQNSSEIHKKMVPYDCELVPNYSKMAPSFSKIVPKDLHMVPIYSQIVPNGHCFNYWLKLNAAKWLTDTYILYHTSWKCLTEIEWKRLSKMTN